MISYSTSLRNQHSRHRAERKAPGAAPGRVCRGSTNCPCFPILGVAVLPDVPAIGDTVARYEAVGWTSIGTPAKTPDDIVTTLNRHVNAALADATFKARLAEVGPRALRERALRVRQFHC